METIETCLHVCMFACLHVLIVVLFFWVCFSCSQKVEKIESGVVSKTRAKDETTRVGNTTGKIT